MAYHLRYYDTYGELVADTVDLDDRGSATDLFDRVCADFDHDIGPDGAVTAELDDNGMVLWKHRRSVREPDVIVLPFVEPEPEPDPKPKSSRKKSSRKKA